MIVGFSSILWYITRDWTPELEKGSAIVLEQIPEDLEWTLTEDGVLTTNQNDVWTIGFDDKKAGRQDVVFFMTGAMQKVNDPWLYVFSDAVIIAQDSKTEQRILYYDQLLEDARRDSPESEMEFPAEFTKEDIVTLSTTLIEKAPKLQKKIKWWAMVILPLLWLIWAVLIAWFITLFVLLGYVIIGSVIWIIAKMIRPLTWNQSWRMAWWLWLVVVVVDMATGFRWTLQVLLILVLSVVYLTWMRRDDDEGEKKFEDYIEKEENLEW